MRETSSLLLHLLLCLSLLSTTTTYSATIPLGSSLTPTNSLSWSSPSNTFSLSFLPTANSPNLYLPSIAYSGAIPIWSPTPLPLPSSSSLSLTSAGNLLLLLNSTTTLWQSNTSGQGVTSATLDDAGNLRLLNSTSATLWQSFDHPTDTLVQTQNFTAGQTLVSAPYSFSFLPNSNLTLTWNSTVVYFNQGNSTLNSTLLAPYLSLQANGILNLFSASLPSPSVVAYSSDYGETGNLLRFLRLDPDGNFRAYTATPAPAAATKQWALVADQCEVFGACGNNGVCSYNDTAPVCTCPSQNFAPVDPADPTRGCLRKLDLRSCTDNWTMLMLNNTKFLTYDPQIQTEQMNAAITACRQNCLSGSSCDASTALTDGSGKCYIKMDNFLSAYQSPALPSTSFVKVCSPSEPNVVSPTTVQSGSHSRLKPWAVGIVVLATVLGLVALELMLWWCFCLNNPKFGPSSAQYALLEYASGAPVHFSYKELHRSTKGFKEKLGAGGFGAVYRGVLANRTVVAVKQLEGIEQGEKQFRMEVATISSTHHLNLVRLIGFCSEGRHRLLVYEFMKNGSLDAFLFSDGPGSSSSTKLNWTARFKVAVGTARGITYLHEECRDSIVHCDIKPENILLDEQYNAKVSDFGLAKLVNPKEHRHHSMASVRGTRGYLAPEWLANLPITSKSDVYSYGMVLLEIASGHRNFDVSEDTRRKKFSFWAYEEFEKGNLGGIVDKRLVESEVDMEQVERVIQVSFWCIQEQPSHRPTMGKVVQMLEGIMEIERPPDPKAGDRNGDVSAISTCATSPQDVSAISTYATSPPDALSSGSFHLKTRSELLTTKDSENAS